MALKKIDRKQSYLNLMHLLSKGEDKRAFDAVAALCADDGVSLVGLTEHHDPLTKNGEFVRAEKYDAVLAAAKLLAAEVQEADVRSLGVSVALDAWYALTDEKSALMVRGGSATYPPAECDALMVIHDEMIVDAATFNACAAKAVPRHTPEPKE